MLIQRFERNQEITSDFVSQGAINACLRSVCIRKCNAIPSDVTFKYVDVQDCMRVSQQMVIQQMKSFDSDEGLGQTMNDSARRYLTNFKNTVSERMEAWQYRTIIADLRYRNHPAVADKKLLTYIARAIIQIVSCATQLDPAMYKATSIKDYNINSDTISTDIKFLHNNHK